MLLELNIENYAVVDKLRVRFHRGLNLLTGETGSGKSIVVDALSLLLGARASSELIRPGCRRARVSGVFEIDVRAKADLPVELGFAELDDAGSGDGESGDGELIVEREILESGKSRAYVNGRVVTLAALRELADALGDIHGQHEQQQLFSPKAQLEMLDDFAGTASAAKQVSETYREWRAAQTRLDELRGNEQERLRLLDLYRFQHREISEANLEADQEEELTRESAVLNNVERVKETAARAYDALYDSAESVTAQLAAAKRDVEELSRYDSTAASWAEPLTGARAAVEDIALELRSYLDRLEPDPKRLADIEEHLALIDKLKRKYGPSLPDVIAYGADIAQKLADIESNDEQIEQAEHLKKELAGRYEDLAGALSEKRRKAGRRLKSMVEKELAALAMEKSVFEVSFEDSDLESSEEAAWTSSGIDRVRFLISANPGQPARPLANVTSGGELSRVTLALKTCLLPTLPTRDEPIPRTLVFDEIDSGVGGRVAESVGRRLQELAKSHQVLCVTHLPQVAGFADAHYFVEKREDKKKTFATIAELSEPERVAELARMLSGESVTSSAVEHAQEILKTHRREAV